MVLIREFRVPMPFSLEEYRLAQRYCTAKLSKQATTGKDGVEVLETKSYVDEKTGEKGQYTYKIYHLDNHVPSWLRTIVPSSALELHEKGWDRFPYCKTVLTNPFLGDRFLFEIESTHAEDEGQQENPLCLREKENAKKKEIFLDIATDQLGDKTWYNEKEDPTKVGNKRMGILSEGWRNSIREKMCCYKVVTIRTKIFGLQTRCEEYLINFERDVFLKFHQQMFCWLDEWEGKTEEQINEEVKRMEEDMNGILKKASEEK